ncbi:MAG TPA: hypothetical protein VFF67_07510 [Thermoplasmata archaeon]|nr:hypothetical protein [Thermoplasmata archaeon]
MRELTEAEYRGVLAVLAYPTSTERQRARAARLPTSTYNVVRRRLAAERQLSEVLIPNPGPNELTGVDFVVARLSLVEREPHARRWSADPECVLLWTGVHAALAVFLRRPARVGTDGPPLETRGPDLHVVSVDGSSGSVPTYFDYSGAWARFGGRPIPEVYPLGLQLDGRPGDVRLRNALQDKPATSVGGALAAPQRAIGLRARRARRRAIEGRIVQSRAILNLRELAPYHGRRIGEVLLVWGRLRPGMGALELLATLRQECGVCPILFAEGSGDVIFAGLGQTSSRLPGRVTVPSARRPVAPILADHLEPAEVFVEPIEGIEERVGHRYGLSTVA